MKTSLGRAGCLHTHPAGGRIPRRRAAPGNMHAAHVATAPRASPQRAPQRCGGPGPPPGSDTLGGGRPGPAPSSEEALPAKRKEEAGITLTGCQLASANWLRRGLVHATPGSERCFSPWLAPWPRLGRRRALRPPRPARAAIQALHTFLLESLARCGDVLYSSTPQVGRR